MRSGYKDPEPNPLWAIVERVRARVLETVPDPDFYARESGLFDGVLAVSSVLEPGDRATHVATISRALRKLPVRGADLYLPYDPMRKVVKLDPDSGVPLQSAAKVPIAVTLEVVDEREGPGAKPRLTQCIFKVGDDCRQDVLALQTIKVLKQQWENANLPLWVCTYGVVPMGYERGVIEFLPGTKSRHELGEVCDGGLLEVFRSRYGAVGEATFEEAREAFLVSAAGYAVASYILNSKDRHNGNILLDGAGHMIHIDFGFILEISPGGNLGFETAAFKLTHEMAQLIDPSGDRKSETFLRFAQLCVKGLLVARCQLDAIVSLFELYSKPHLPCFERGNPLESLKRRLMVGVPERVAARRMVRKVADAYDKGTTNVYDVVQYLQNRIAF